MIRFDSIRVDSNRFVLMVGLISIGLDLFGYTTLIHIDLHSFTHRPAFVHMFAMHYRYPGFAARCGLERCGRTR